MLNEKTAPAVTKDESKQKNNEVKKYFAGLGAGYYMAMGDIGSAVNPGITVKGLFQYSGIKYDFLGAEFEAGYTDLKDKEYSGGITFIYCIPSAMYIYPTGFCDIQVKAGMGITSTSSKLTANGQSQSESSMDLTAGIGAGALKTFKDRYAAGVDLKYYYIFETVKTGAIAFNIIIGVKF